MQQNQTCITSPYSTVPINVQVSYKTAAIILYPSTSFSSQHIFDFI